MATGRKTPTIQDVARHASVSTATVSRALSAPELVSEAMRARVEAAVRATGYTLNQSARSLRSRTTRTILVALPNVSNPFFSPILDAVEREAAGRGYGVLVANSAQDETSHKRLRDYFHSHRADGLLLFDGSLPRTVLDTLFPDPGYTPVVVACEEIDQARYCTVKTDNPEAAARLTDHLIELGHRRIAHVAGPAGNSLAPEREAGFRRAVETAGLSLPGVYVAEGGFTIDSGVAAARRLMALPVPPTAVFCGNDEMAMGFISQARSMGFSCPGDVSVAGFDDIEIAVHFAPPLTTVRQPTDELGRLAAQALLDRLEGQAGWEHPTRIVLRSQLIVRGSTAPPVSEA